MALKAPTYLVLQSAHVVREPVLLKDKGEYKNADFVYSVKLDFLNGTVDHIPVLQVILIEQMLVQYVWEFCRKEVEEKTKLQIEDFTIKAHAMQNPAIVTVTRNR